MNTELPIDLTLPNGLHWVSLTQPQGRITPVHQHVIGQLFGTEKGLLTADFEHSQWAIPATHAVWVPAACSHGMRSHGAFHGWSVYMGQDLTSQLPAQPKTFLVEGLLREALKRVKRWQDEETSVEARQALTTVILEEIRLAPGAALELPMPKDARLLHVTRGILNDVSVQYNAEQWAAMAGLSGRTLVRLFPLHTGLTFTAWRQRARILRAMELLAQGMAVQNVALDVGYDNTSAFIAVFRHLTGSTPGQSLLRV